MLFFTELWERFAYYGMRALLILYLIDTATGGLGWSQERASRLYGWFTGLVYLTPVLGGWLADRYLGTRRALAVGGFVLSSGYFTLALGRNWSFYTGLGLIVLGTGFFKPNGYTMVGQLYGTGDPRRDPGFTIYYMAINLGALFGPLICAWLAADPRYGWSYGFAASGTAMLIGLLFYLWARRFRLQGIGLPPARQTGQGRLEAPLTPVERGRILAVAIITVFVVFFWLAFEQVGSSLNVFAAHRTDRLLSGWLGRVAARAGKSQPPGSRPSIPSSFCCWPLDGRALAPPGHAGAEHAGQDGTGADPARSRVCGDGDRCGSG